ncbi:hypothetical protein Tco_0884806 [Tanacetum coccineum]
MKKSDKLNVREETARNQGAGASGALVPFTTVGDLDVLTKDIEAGKHEDLLFGMTNDKHKADDSTIVDALVAENLNVNESLIVQSVFIQDKHSSNIAVAEGS